MSMSFQPVFIIVSIIVVIIIFACIFCCLFKLGRGQQGTQFKHIRNRHHRGSTGVFCDNNIIISASDTHGDHGGVQDGGSGKCDDVIVDSGCNKGGGGGDSGGGGGCDSGGGGGGDSGGGGGGDSGGGGGCDSGGGGGDSGGGGGDSGGGGGDSGGGGTCD